MKVTLIIKTFEQPKELEAVFKSIAKGTMFPGEIIIADDGSGKETEDLICDWQKKTLHFPIYHCWQENTGFHCTSILNKAIEIAKYDYIIFLDADCIPHKRFIQDHIKLAEPGCFVQGRRAFIKEKAVKKYLSGTSILRLLLTGNMSGIFKAFRLPWPIIRKDQELHGILGCNIGAWKQDLLDINGYDEEYKGWGLEDSDLGCRLYHLGRVRKLVHNHAVVYHLNHPIRSRDSYKSNHELLQETIVTKKIKCINGIVKDHKCA